MLGKILDVFDPKKSLHLFFTGIFSPAHLTLKYEECQLWPLVSL